MRRTLWIGQAGSVVEAMARASRHAPRPRSAAAAAASNALSDGPTSDGPRFLTPELRALAQQRPSSLKPAMAAPQEGSGEPSLMANVEAAQARLAASLQRFRELSARQPEVETATAAQQKSAAAEKVRKTTTAATASRDGDALAHEHMVAAAVANYNPDLHPQLIQRIADQAAIADRLHLAAQLVRYLRDAAAASLSGEERDAVSTEAVASDTVSAVPTPMALDLLQRAVEVCRASRSASRSRSVTGDGQRYTPWAPTTEARESAGIAARLHRTAASPRQQTQQRRRALPRCFVRYASDVQASEVLASGAVVVFTEPTHPDAVDDRTATPFVQQSSSGHGTAAGSKKAPPPPSLYASLVACLAEGPAEVHLHFVLHRCGHSLPSAVARLVAEADGAIAACDVFARDILALEDRHVVVQLASVRLRLPAALRERGRRDEALQHCLHIARTLAQVNLAAAPEGTSGGGVARLAVQLLYCQTVSCLSSEWTPQRPASMTGVRGVAQVQYAVLLRGFDHRGGPPQQLDRAALACSDTIPNYFPPDHFGPAAVPFFRTYHATAALESRRYAEAAAILLCLDSDAGCAVALPAWLQQALAMLCAGEDREGAWQAWWLHAVPQETQRRVRDARADLVWNALASCRLHELAMATRGRHDAMMASTPALGDFVSSSSDGGTAAAADADGHAPTPAAANGWVRPLYTTAEAAPYAIHDVVLPLLRDPGSSCDAVAQVEAALGFPRRRGRAAPSAVSFRPLFASASGFPRSVRPWARSFQEPVSAALGDGAAGSPGPALLSLTSDWEIATRGRSGRDYAAGSRGPRAQMWPLSKRGRAVADRLPAGLLAAASADGSSLAGSRAPAARRHTSRCLAIHCTLPTDVPLSNYVGEFASVEDLREA